jgi:hypothetical protein
LDGPGPIRTIVQVISLAAVRYRDDPFLLAACALENDARTQRETLGGLRSTRPTLKSRSIVLCDGAGPAEEGESSDSIGSLAELVRGGD